MKELGQFIRQDCRESVCQNIHLLKKLRNQCILITGGTGFMGTWLAEMINCLNDEYHFNIKLILLSEHANAFLKNTPHIARKDVMLITRGIASITEIPSEVNYIIHAAANPDNRIHSSNPLYIAQTIVNGTQALLNASSRLSDLRNVVNISSGLIYGVQPLELERIPESYVGGPDCSSTISVYAEAKRYGETMCAIYRNQYKMPILNVRPFAFIGPYQLLDRPWAINNFLHDCLIGKPIRILGDGQTIRSYMYPSDMAYWLLRILADGAPGESYNMGSPFGLTLCELAEKIAHHFDVKPSIQLSSAPSSSKVRSRFVPDVSLAHKSLGLTITVQLDDAIRKTIIWNRKLIANM